MIKRTGIGIQVYSICFFAVLFMIAGCTIRGQKKKQNLTQQENASIIYHVKYRDHSGIIIDRQRAAPYLSILENEFPDAKFLEFGRGDLKWYKTDKDRRHFGLQLRAILFSTSSGMFVWSLPRHPEKQYSHDKLKKIAISDITFNKLMQQISSSFALDDENKIIFEISNMDKGGEYRIYRARGKYHLFNNCNTWVDKILKKSGIYSN
jgi:hypothetical protein